MDARSLPTEEEAKLALTLLEGIGQGLSYRLYQTFGSASAVFSASLEELQQIEGVGERLAKRILLGFPKERVAKIREKLEAKDIWLLYRDDPDYPQGLTRLSQPPFLLYGRGERSALQKKERIAIVGTRQPSEFGVRLSEESAHTLGKLGFPLISGGARGVDTVVHQTALKVGTPTWVLMGCSVDIAYPAENAHLFTQIYREGGLLLSEFPPSTRPEKGYFPRRNRLIAALCDALLVVQCSLDSGAMNTAHHAQRLQIPIFAFPSRPYDPLATGPHQLIRQGAHLIEDPCEIATFLQEDRQLDLWASSPSTLLSPSNLPLSSPQKLPSFEGAPPITKKNSSSPAAPSQMPSHLQELWSCFDTNPLHIDDLALALGCPVHEISVKLIELELGGWVQSIAGMRYIRKDR
jgi:DNA processing protein